MSEFFAGLVTGIGALVFFIVILLASMEVRRLARRERELARRAARRTEAEWNRVRS